MVFLYNLNMTWSIVIATRAGACPTPTPTATCRIAVVSCYSSTALGHEIICVGDIKGTASVTNLMWHTENICSTRLTCVLPPPVLFMIA